MVITKDEGIISVEKDVKKWKVSFEKNSNFFD